MALWRCPELPLSKLPHAVAANGAKINCQCSSHRLAGSSRNGTRTSFDSKTLLQGVTRTGPPRRRGPCIIMRLNKIKGHTPEAN
jgi:hypothetical protein